MTETRFACSALGQISLQRRADCPWAMPWPFLTSPDGLGSCELTACEQCNENIVCVTKIKFRSKNVTKCNESIHILDKNYFSLHFFTFLLRRRIFATPTVFSLHSQRACVPHLFKTPGIGRNTQGVAEGQSGDRVTEFSIFCKAKLNFKTPVWPDDVGSDFVTAARTLPPGDALVVPHKPGCFEKIRNPCAMSV